MSPAIMLVATVGTLTAYVVGYPGLVPIVIGLGLGLGMWILLSLVVLKSGRTSAAGARPSHYTDLYARRVRLATRLQALPEHQTSGSYGPAWQEANSQLQEMETELAATGSQWVFGTGYASLFSLAHRIQEALVGCDVIPNVADGALYDELRLQDSKIPNADRLLTKLRRAVATLSPAAAIYLNEQPPASKECNPTNGTTGEMEARAALREVKHAVNQYREDQWNGLVRQLSLLLTTLAIASLVTFLMLSAVVIASPNADHVLNPLQTPVLTAAAFFLVGAFVSLVNRLRAEAGSSTAQDDYGLGAARILVTPVLGGMAAVVGVCLIVYIWQTLPSVGLAASPTPTATPAATATVVAPPRVAGPQVGAAPSAAPIGSSELSPTPTPVVSSAPSNSRYPRLSEIYDLASHPEYLVLAALFGFAPSLLLNTLQQVADNYKAQLKASEASG